LTRAEGRKGEEEAMAARLGGVVFFVCWCRAYSTTFLALSAAVGGYKGGEKAQVEYKFDCFGNFKLIQ
jgi:hypothetical protein